ncbi:MAG: biotin transporter BioY [Desulfobacteraceae bacterium]|nr:biotin transporter BioY [Desulfobacteraceae bacterium]
MEIKELQRVVYASLLAALIAVGAYIAIPIPIVPVPIVLQNLFVLLAGLLLGSRWALATMGIYLLAGSMGLPVFSGGRGGLAHFLGPTGGYLIGFTVEAWLVGFISERFKGRLPGDITAVVIGTLMVYAFGVPWLKVVSGMEWSRAVLLGMAPFLIGDIIKAAAAILIVKALRPVVSRSMEAVSA